MGPVGCPETLVRNYHYSLRNKLEEHSSFLIKMLAACIHISRACLVETDLCTLTVRYKYKILFGCVVNRSQSDMKFKSSGLHAFRWQVYTGVKINKEGPLHLSFILWRNVVTWRKATSMASISNGPQWSSDSPSAIRLQGNFFLLLISQKTVCAPGRSGFGGRDKQSGAYKVIKPGNPAGRWVDGTSRLLKGSL
jgi:hypothetical protein